MIVEARTFWFQHKMNAAFFTLSLLGLSSTFYMSAYCMYSVVDCINISIIRSR